MLTSPFLRLNSPLLNFSMQQIPIKVIPICFWKDRGLGVYNKETSWLKEKENLIVLGLKDNKYGYLFVLLNKL